MSRADIIRDVAKKNHNEGTAARTRPVDLEEILSRRKKKLNADDKGVSQIKYPSEKDEKVVLSDRRPDGKKDSKDREKGDSKRPEQAISKKGQERIERKDKVDLVSETKMKVRSNSDKSNRDKESKNEKPSHHRRNSHRSVADSEKDSEKKDAKVSKGRDKHEERERRSGKEVKRKHENHNDDRNRSLADGSLPKKHDSGKLHDTEYSERKDQKKEHSRTHHEEPKAKKRRSRSREYDRDRGRSPSMSPRAHRRSNHGREYDEPVFQSSKDKPRRKYSDAGDMYRTSGNGGYGSGHYRKHGSGLGGYSPRKRRTGVAVKTPSPTRHSPEKRSSTWDQPPGGTSYGGSGSMFASLQTPSSRTFEAVPSNAVAQITTKPQPLSSLDGTSVLINASVESVQLTQATRPQRRLYIENLPPTTSEKSVVDCLNDFLFSAGVNHIKGAKPCISCIVCD